MALGASFVPWPQGPEARNVFVQWQRTRDTIQEEELVHVFTWLGRFSKIWKMPRKCLKMVNFGVFPYMLGVCHDFYLQNSLIQPPKKHVPQTLHGKSWAFKKSKICHGWRGSFAPMFLRTGLVGSKNIPEHFGHLRGLLKIDLHKCFRTKPRNPINLTTTWRWGIPAKLFLGLLGYPWWQRGASLSRIGDLVTVSLSIQKKKIYFWHEIQTAFGWGVRGGLRSMGEYIRWSFCIDFSFSVLCQKKKVEVSDHYRVFDYSITSM